MRVGKILSVLVAGSLLAACASAAPSPQPTLPAAAGAPTSPAGGLGAAPTADAAPTSPPTNAEPARPTFTVQRGEIVDEITLEGRIVQVEQGVSFGEDGILKAVYVNAGSTVEAGQLLAELDNTLLESQLSQAQSILTQDQRALSQAGARGEIAVKQAQVDLSAARTALEEMRRPARPDEIARARAAVQQAEATLQTTRNNTSQDKNQALRTLDTAVKNLLIVQDLYGYAKLEFENHPREETRDAYIALRNDLLAAEDAVTAARIAADTARSNEVSLIQRDEGIVAATKADLDRLLVGPDPFDIARAEQAVSRAEIALAAARQAAVPDTELSKQVARSQAEVERLNQQIADRRLIAPLSGQITSIEALPGMPVRAATPLMTIANPDRRELLVAMTNTGTATAANRTTRLLLGQEVSISFARYPGRSIPGVISSAPGSNNRVSADSVLPDNQYGVSYDGQGLDLAIGDRAEVTVVLDVIENALWLPPAAVIISRDRSFVTVEENGQDERVEVRTGIVTQDRIEIISGLEENDVVLVNPTPTR